MEEHGDRMFIVGKAQLDYFSARTGFKVFMIVICMKGV